MNFCQIGTDVKWERDFGFELAFSNVITEVRIAPACKVYVRSGRGLILSDPNWIVWDRKDGPGKWASKLEEEIR